MLHWRGEQLEGAVCSFMHPLEQISALQDLLHLCCAVLCCRVGAGCEG